MKENPLPFFKNLVDLTHPLEKNMPVWEEHCEFELQLKGVEGDNPKFYLQEFKMEAGIGTHLDAPSHLGKGKSVDQLSLNQLCAPCAVIDVSEKAHENYSLTVEDIAEFEKKHGQIPPGYFVMIRTGWERFWSQPDKYRNQLRFPAVSKEAGLLLLDRQIVGLGIDTLSPDREGEGYPVHVLLLGAGKFLVENAANLQLLPPMGSFLLALPIKLKEGSEAPLRLIAFF